jgi:hypothetical protein
MKNFLNRLNAWLDAVTNRSLENIVSQFERTQRRLQAFKVRRSEEVDALLLRISKMGADADLKSAEAFRAGRIAEKIDELLK